MKTIFSLFLIPCFATAFTLNSAGRGFGNNEIDIHIANTDCSNAGFSVSKLRDLIQDAVDDYWNGVASSSVKLSARAVGSADIDGLSFAEVLDSGLVPANSILAGCGDAPFDEGSTTLGGAQMSCEGDTCRAVFIINARADSQMQNLNRKEQIAVMAHELGHAIGLGHSEYTHNLMYYSIGGKTQQWLGQDDIDGVSYLYPQDPVGCDFFPLFGSMGAVKDISKTVSKTKAGPIWAFPASAMAGFFLFIIITFLAGRLYLFRGFNSLPSN